MNKPKFIAFCLVPSVLLVMFLGLLGHGGEEFRFGSQAVRNETTTPDLECDGTPGNVQSRVVMIDNDKYQAFIQVSTTGARNIQRNQNLSEWKYCRVTWTIQVSSDYGHSFSSTEIEEHEQDEYFGLEGAIVGWSEDRTRLLMIVREFAGDYTAEMPVVYDLGRKKIWKSDFENYFDGWVKNHKDARVPKWCTHYFTFGGFTEDRSVAFDVTLFSFDPPSPNPCTQKTGWQWKPETGEIFQTASGN